VRCARLLRASLAPRTTLAVFAVSGLVVALAEWGVLPQPALLVAAPAVVAALLVDTALYNAHLVRTGSGFWPLLYGFLLLQSAVVAGVVARVRAAR